jgi:hypothetical protein
MLLNKKYIFLGIFILPKMATKKMPKSLFLKNVQKFMVRHFFTFF